MALLENDSPVCIQRDEATGKKQLGSSDGPSAFIPFQSRIGKEKDSEYRTDILLLAWALLLRRSSGSDDVQFVWGYAYVADTKDALLLPKSVASTEHISLHSSQSVSSLLETIRLARRKADISNESRPQDEYYMFLNDGSDFSQPNGHLEEGNASNWNFEMGIRCTEENLCLIPKWRPNAMSKSTAMDYLPSFAEIVNSALCDQSQTVSQLVGLSEKDLDTLWEWNGCLPPTLDQCMHDIITKVSQSRPNSPAVESWDGKLTYCEVDQLSTHVAHRLLALGVELDIVPVCFEKSMWTVVAVLGVMKAGAAFSLIDPNQPEARLRGIVAQVKAKVILTSKTQHALGTRLTDDAHIIIAGPDTTGEENTSQEKLPLVPSSGKMYIQFTSGSTGQPKGVMISHASYTSGAVPRSEIVGYKPHSRVLDFASYAFDVSIDCMLCTLVRGGCLCVPSDEARVNDLGGTIQSMNVNMAHMTPSVARVLDLHIISCLEVLGLGGETVTSRDAALWTPYTRIIIAYGPSECTVGCTVNGNVVASGQNPNIGTGVGGVIWIVDPEDHNQLMPIGAVGELLVEGPIVGQGYIDVEKSSKVFISDPTWLQAGSRRTPGRCGRLYKTGDLAKYHEDGTIIFVGRKDTQVKLRGQRVELGEVEHHLRLVLPAWTEVAAEIIVPKTDGANTTLVAFLAGQPPEGESTREAAGERLDEEGGAPKFHPLLTKSLSGIEQELSKTLPVYMLPSAYIPIQKMPLMVSGKLDRKRLREIGSTFSPRQLTNLRASGVQSRAPETATELKLQNIWSCLLGVHKDIIAAGDNFFGLGADSILVMRLVSAARAEGLALTVQNAFSHPQLSDMASVITTCDESETDVPEFSLLDRTWTNVAFVEAATLCGIPASSVEDIYPCTPLQEGLMALSAKRTEAYVAQRVVEVPDKEAEITLRAAWEATVEGCAVLRTRIIYSHGHGLLQVIVKERISWATGSDLEEYLETDRESTMQLGTQLARYGIITNKTTGKRYFVWTIHHALYDGWSMPLIMERVRRLYNGLITTRPAEFKHFIKYLCDLDREASQAFWSSQLQGANYSQFPGLPSPGYEPRANSLLERHVHLVRQRGSKNTVSTIIRAAWALVTALLTGRDDVVFGETLIGRNIPIANVEQIEGPMITTVPVRVKVDKKMSVQDFLQSLHHEAVLRMPHEHFGLQHIRRLSPDAQVACDLRTGLVIQPSQVGDSADEVLGGGLAPVSDVEAAREALKFNSYGLMLVFSLDPEGFLIMASFDTDMVGVPRMEKVLEELETVVQELCQEENLPIEQLQGLNLSQRESEKLSHATNIQTPTRELAAITLSPLTKLERKLQSLWSSIIGIPVTEINTNDHFFRLGGDSISAMKLVAAVRLDGLQLTVAHVFSQPLLSDMALSLEKVNPSQTKETVTYQPYSGLDLLNMFLSEIIQPALADPLWRIKDVLPTTTLQEGAVAATIAAPRFSVQYNLLYLDPSIDEVRLFENLQDLIVHHEILRTVYVQHGSRCLQVVLEELTLPVTQYETEDDVESFTKELCATDADTDMPLGSSFLKFMFVTSKGNKAQKCLVIRMSHAQYDGICLPGLILQLKSLYDGEVLDPMPQYSSYVYSMIRENIAESHQHWRNLLQGSSVSRVGPRSAEANTMAEVSPISTSVSKSVSIASRPREITPSTFLTAAWATILARTNNIRDVVFGRVVSGRSVDIPFCERIMGPCDNHNPVRVSFQPHWTFLELLHYVQDQHVGNARYENTQLRDVVKFCTEWKEADVGLTFDSVVHHQDIGYFDTMELGGTQCVLDAINPHAEPALEWKVQSYFKDGNMVVEIVCSESWQELAQQLLDGLCDVIADMVRDPKGQIFKTGVDLKV